MNKIQQTTYQINGGKEIDYKYSVTKLIAKKNKVNKNQNKTTTNNKSKYSFEQWRRSLQITDIRRNSVEKYRAQNIYKTKQI